MDRHLNFRRRQFERKETFYKGDANEQARAARRWEKRLPFGLKPDPRPLDAIRAERLGTELEMAARVLCAVGLGGTLLVVEADGPGDSF